MQHTNARLAALAGIRQVNVSVKANAAAARVEAVIRRNWNRLLTALAGQRVGIRLVSAEWQTHLTAITGHAVQSLEDSLYDIASWGERSATVAVAQAVPLDWLRYAAAQKAAANRPRPVAEGKPPLPQFKWRPEIPTSFAGMTADDVLELLFPAFTRHETESIIFGGADWRDHFQALTKLATPDELAPIITQGLIAGKTQQQIAYELRPAVHGLIVSAKRTARTQCLRVAQAAQERCHAQLGDLIIGWMVHATLDQFTRHWHAARSGTVYYLQPGPGQKGMLQCPHPPAESEDASERPPRTPHIAPNCRCWLTPVLADPRDAALHKTLAAAAPVAPDMATFGDWFQQAPEHLRKLAVGTKRYNFVRDQLQRPPVWNDFLDPEAKGLMPLDRLKAERTSDWLDRQQAVSKIMYRRKVDSLHQRTFGYLNP